jgi:dTDP-4-dehydrorhamnose 3,5-epimerase
MLLIQTGLAGVFVVESQAVSDQRGFFMRLFCGNELESILAGRQIVQINQSITKSVGAVRGMHIQNPPHAEMKFVRCLRGKAWDVAVDLRMDSPTFLKWYAVELTPGNSRMLVIPEGCAHGYQCLEENSELLYLHTAPYTPAAEGGVPYNDPKLDIRWPLPATDVSVRDLALLPIAPDFFGIKV